MPYIDSESRDALRAGQRPFASVGELNYYITTACVAYISNRTMEAQDRVRYSDLNDVIGALECAKQEMYRRVGSPLEDAAIRRNGDVYPDHLTDPDDPFVADATAVEHPHCGTDRCCNGCHPPAHPMTRICPVDSSECLCSADAAETCYQVYHAGPSNCADRARFGSAYTRDERGIKGLGPSECVDCGDDCGSCGR